MKKYLISLLGVSLLAVLATGAMYAFAKKQLREEVERQLEAFSDDRIVIANVALGVHQQHVYGLRLIADDQTAGWLTIDEAWIDLPLSDAVFGKTEPRKLTVLGSSIVLYLDNAGRLITPWKQADEPLDLPAPQMEIRQARLEVRQSGREPFVATDLTMRFNREQGELTVEGTLGQGLGAHWSISGAGNLEQGVFAGRVVTEMLRVDSRQLARLPLIPSRIVEIPCTLQTPVVATIRHSASETQYRVELAPESVDCRFPGIEIPVRRGRGEVVIENHQATIHHFTAEVAGGTADVDGRFDFRTAEAAGAGSVSLRDVDLKTVLQARSKFDVAGRLEGQLDFVVSYPSRVVVTGQGDFLAQDVMIEGVALDPVSIRLALTDSAGANKQALVAGLAEADFRVPDVDVRHAAALMEIAEEQRNLLEGSVGVNGTVKLPLETIENPATYELAAKVNSSQLRFGEIELEQLDAALQLFDGKVDVHPFTASLSRGGLISGRLSTALEHEILSGTITLTEVPSDWALTLVDADAAPLTGALATEATLKVPVRQMSDLAAWAVNGKLASAELSFDAVDENRIRLEDVQVDYALADARLELSHAAARWNEALIEGAAVLQVNDQRGFQALFRADKIDLQRISAMLSPDERHTIDETDSLQFPRAQGELSLRGDVAGTLKPFSFLGEGEGSSNDVAVGRLEVGRLRFGWTASESAASLDGARVEMFDGSVSLNATVPWETPELSRMHGVFRDINVEQLAETIDASLPVEPMGAVSGDFQLTSFLDLRQASATASFAGSTAKVNDLLVEGLVGRLAWAQQRAELTIAGRSLGGQVVISGSSGKEQPPWQPPWEGRLTVADVRLREVWPLLPVPDQLQAINARGSLQLDVDWADRATWPEGKGTLALRGVRWNNREMSSELGGRLLLADGVLRLQDVSTRIARGTARGNIALLLDQPGRGEFTIDLDRVASREVIELYPRDQSLAALRDLSGPVSLTLRGQLGRTMTGTGQVVLHSMRWHGIDFQNVRAPLDWSFRPEVGQGRTRVRLGSARIANGNVRGEIELRWGRLPGVRSKLQFSSLQIQPLAQLAPTLRDVISGQLDGQLELQGRNIRGIEDLSGQYDLRLRNSQSLAFPVLNALTPSLGVGSPQSFRTTEAEGSFRRGVLYIDRLTLERPQQRVWIEGTVHARGRLDLDVTADTQQLQATAAVLGFIQPTQLLQRRLVFLHVGGTVRRPIVRPRTAELIQQELLQFFLPVLPFPVPEP